MIPQKYVSIEGQIVEEKLYGRLIFKLSESNFWKDTEGATPTGTNTMFPNKLSFFLCIKKF